MYNKMKVDETQRTQGNNKDLSALIFFPVICMKEYV